MKTGNRILRLMFVDLFMYLRFEMKGLGVEGQESRLFRPGLTKDTLMLLEMYILKEAGGLKAVNEAISVNQ